MGLVNLLKANFTGRLGQTVGAKWKDKSTIRTYTKPAYTDYPDQHNVRQSFGEMSGYVALFADQIKSLSALNTKSMSVRNAIIALNKAQIPSGQFDPTTLIVSRGGLPQPTNVQAVAPAGLQGITVTWSQVTGPTISTKSRVVAIAVGGAENFAVAGSALNSAQTLTLSGELLPSTNYQIYVYLLDYRGSTRVGSPSQHLDVTTPASRTEAGQTAKSDKVK